MSDKMRVHILAKELSVPSKVIVEKCKAEGIPSVKNHMSTLSAGLHATIREWFSEGTHDTVVETTNRIDLRKVKIKASPKKSKTIAKPAAATIVVEDQEAQQPEPVAVAAAAEVSISIGTSEPTTISETPALGEAVSDLPPAAQVQPITSAEVAAQQTPTAPVSEEPQAPPATKERGDTETTPVAPAGPQNIPAKAKLQGPRVVHYVAPDHDVAPISRRPSARRSEGGAPISTPRANEPVPPGADRGFRKKGRSGARGASGRGAEGSGGKGEWRNQDLQERKARLAGATGRRTLRRRTTTAGVGPSRPSDRGPITEATVHEPIYMKEFCSETGLNFLQCYKVLHSEHNIMANINMVLPIDTAQLLSLHFGIDLTVVPSKTLLDKVREEFEGLERKSLRHRPPVVTMLGHVDHGKTSLLDAIRTTTVASSEDGGITQHIGAYHLNTPHGAVTFLDTPGHEAFTAMRARGAELTDVVVLLVAADDGVMPQTIEAINHAKAAEVPIVVALNKIDLGTQNKIKIFGQLSEQGLTPSGEWGGEVDVIETSATGDIGITELVEHLAHLSEILDLKADPTLPAAGSVIEAETQAGVGAVARVLVQEGTLRVGNFIVCGPAFGKVRALVDDHGLRIEEATPSIPVEVWGLDTVPSSGDQLFVVETLQRAKSVATETRQSRVGKARLQTRKVRTLEEMFQQRNADEIAELNLLIKADVDGSVAALRHSLGQIPSDEVRLTIRHAGVGAVNDSDVALASACDGMIVAYRSEVTQHVKRLAEQSGVEIRSYRVIYDVHDDVRKALEGLLKPEERIEHRATLEVRELFRLSRRAGVIAGSMVVDGVVNRSQLVNVIRNGTIIRERSKIASLRRFKDDVKEVRSGMECGIKLEGFDDLHVGDSLDVFEIIEVARTLD